jgi:hypothetical protein
LDDIFCGHDKFNSEDDQVRQEKYTMQMEVKFKRFNNMGNKVKDGLEFYKRKDVVCKEEIYITEKMAKEVFILNL